MKRNRFALPRSIESFPRHGDAAAASLACRTARGTEGKPPLTRGVLAHPTPARPRYRRWFDPVAGRIRRLERWLNHSLSLHVYPSIPGISRVYGRQLAASLSVAEAEIPVARLHRDLDGLHVVLVSDLHSGPFLTPRDLGAALDRIRGLDPDVILLGGDVATSRVQDVARAVPSLRSLRAPLGTFAVLGNHDHYTGDPSTIRRDLERAGIGVLHNRCVVVERGGGQVCVAGIDDLNVGKPDLEAALVDAPADVPVLLLSHNPDVLFEAAARGVSLVLAGHTHGGQIRIPGLPVLVRMSRFRLDEGRFRSGSTELVVSRGLGVVGLPLRIACPPEVASLKLRSA